MRKYKELLNDFVERVKEKGGCVDPALLRCTGRAQLLAHLKGSISDYYRAGVLDTKLLREAYEEAELNKQGIYTTGVIAADAYGKTVVVAGNCHCEAVAGVIMAFDEAIVDARGSSRVYAYGHVLVNANMRSVVTARDECRVTAEDFSSVKVYDDVTLIATDRSSTTAFGGTSVEASGDAYVRVLSTTVSIKAYGYATVHHKGSLKDMAVEGCAVAINTETNDITLGGGLVKV